MARRRVGMVMEPRRARRLFAEPVPVRIVAVGSGTDAAAAITQVDVISLIGSRQRLVKRWSSLSSILFDQSIDLEPGQYFLSIYKRSSTSIVNVTINGVPHNSGGGWNAYTSRVNVPFVVRDSATASRAAASSGGARYEVKSPVVNGTYYTGVRELSARELASYKNRGFTVRPTTSEVTPMVRVRAGSRPPRPAARGRPRVRHGISTVPVNQSRPGRRRVTTGRDIFHKSTRARVWAEPGANANPFMAPSDWVILRKRTRNRWNYVVIRDRDAYRWRSSGWGTPYTKPDTAAGRAAIIRVAGILGQNGRLYWKTPRPGEAQPYRAPGQPLPPAALPSPPPPAPAPAPVVVTVPAPAQDLSGLRAELARLRTEVNGLHAASRDLGASATALGGATTDRANEIRALTERYNAEIADVHAKLTALGSAGGDSSAAVADLHAKIDALAAQVAATKAAAGVGAAAGGAANPLGSLTQILPMIIVVVVLMMVVKK